jgi:two-component system, chemotaxis family, CheB/CheR fusion protein
VGPAYVWGRRAGAEAIGGLPEDIDMANDEQNSNEQRTDEEADAQLAHIAYPSPEPEHFLIAGVGASAGGLEAFSQLLKSLPRDPGLAIVFVQHVAPHHESALATVLATSTDLPIVQPSHDIELEANHVYLIPPNRNLALKNRTLLVRPRPTDRSQFTPVDTFFQSMATELGPEAVGIVLSGTASDGVEGVHAIKAAGGTTIVQSPETAKQDGMPRSAIATGKIDLVLSPTEIAGELVRMAHQSLVRDRPHGSDDLLLEPDQLDEIFSLLRSNSGVDFAQYKLPTVQRRIQRRMALHRSGSVDQYLKVLQSDPAEVNQLYQDILIHVTRFFREPDSFTILADEVFPAILEGRQADTPIRIWIPACSTGEEPYSVAITLVECLGQRTESAPIQIFATDISETAIDQARAGLYPPSALEGLSPERLRRFFTKSDGQYRIHKPLRDLCVFARQDLTRDPPFSKLDLIVCRNVLIYLGQTTQNRLISVFHYALKPTGFLMLGSAETIGSHNDLFTVSDKKHRIYRKRPVQIPTEVQFTVPYPRPSHERVHTSGETVRSTGSVHNEANRLILDRYAPPGVIVNDELRIVQFRGQTGRFLEPAPGDASLNLLKMCREGLLHGLRSALQTAKKNAEPVRREGLRVKTNGDFINVSLDVVPLTAANESRHYLILFQDISPAAPLPFAAPKKSRAKNTTTKEFEEEIERLQKELIASREYLQSIIQDLEAANEELQSANEEILSSNEELQSTNEELDTAKEELQSTNEELNTVNDELHGRNDELARINSDLINLLNGMQMAIVIVDSNLKISRYTPIAEKVLNLLPGDIGRPISQIKPNINCPDLEKIILDVIDSITVQHHDVQDLQGRTYSLTVRPYKNVDNRIDGAVLALFNVDEVRHHQSQAQEARDYADVIFNAALDPMIVLDRELRVDRVNHAFSGTLGAANGDIIGSAFGDVFGGQWNQPELRKHLQDVVWHGKAFDGFELTYRLASGAQKRIRLAGRRIGRSDKQPALVLVTIREVS